MIQWNKERPADKIAAADCKRLDVKIDSTWDKKTLLEGRRKRLSKNKPKLSWRGCQSETLIEIVSQDLLLSHGAFVSS